MPKVDVIIPTCNRSQFLRSAIGSVLSQVFGELRLIIVDDGSSDDTPSVVRSFDDNRIKYIRHETTKGEAGARNTGIMNSDAKYVAFLDDDDEWLPEKLRVQVDFLEVSPTKVGAIYTGYIAIKKANGEIIGRRIPKIRGDIHRDMFFGNRVGSPSTVLLR
jgi:glycosyltransferase involved in cell wall biosynthesis